MSGPARGYKWPEATPGNAIALKHGVYSAHRGETVAADVEALAEDVAGQYPWTAAYSAERRAYARAVLDEQAVRDYLDQVGLLDSKHRERPAVRTLERFSARASRCRAALGLNPASHARLLVMVASVVRGGPEHPALLDGNLAALLAEGHAALERGSQSDGEA